MLKKLLLLFSLFCLPAFGQQPQTSNAPVYAVNAKWVQGVGPGYWPRAGSGFTLNIAAGSVVCNGTVPITYAGGSLTLAPNTTSYVMLNSGASCVPFFNTTGFIAGNPPIASVVTNGTHITSLSDFRPIVTGGASGSGSGLTTVAAAPDSGGALIDHWNNSPVTVGNQPGPLTPVFIPQPAGYVFMGPQTAVPGLAAIINVGLPQTFHSGSNLLSFDYTGFTGTVQVNDRLIVQMSCSGNNVNVGTPTITDTLGLTWSNFINSGGEGQILSSNVVSGGVETHISATLAYGGGQICPDLAVEAIEVNGLSGLVNTSVGGALLNAGGHFSNNFTTTVANTLLVFQSSTNNPASPPTIDPGPPIFNSDQSGGSSQFGTSVYADSFTTDAGLYNIGATVTGGIGTFSRIFVGSYDTGGTFSATGSPTFKPLTCGDFLVVVAQSICSPFLVYKNAPTVYTASSATQDFTASRVFLPNSNNATVSHFGELAEDSNNGFWSAFGPAGEEWLAPMPHNFNPVDGHSAIWFNVGGDIHLIDGGAPASSPAFSAITSGTNTAAAMVVGSGASLDYTGTGTIHAKTVAAFDHSPTNCTGSNFTVGINADGSSNCAVPSGSGSSPTLSTNSVANGSQTILDFLTSITNTNNLVATPIYSATGHERFEITYNNVAINTVLAGPPSGGSAPPTFQTAPTISAANMTNFPAANTPVEIQSTAYLTPDTNFGTDDTTALQSAITAACTTPGGTLVLAAGQYKITSALVLPNKGCHIRGVGTNGGGPGTGGPQLASATIGCFTSSIAAMTSGTTSTANYQGPWLENLQFIDKTGGKTCGGGLLLVNQSYSTLTNLGFQGFSLAKTAAPSTPSLTPGTSGSLAAGTYFVAISDTDDIGHETLTGTAVSAVTSGASGSIALASHTPVSPMTKFNVYAGSTAATLHLITQGHATGTYTITALANSNIAPPSFDESTGYGLTTLGTAGGYGTLSGGFSNQNILNNIQVFSGTLNGIVADRNNSETFVHGGNLNLDSNTSGCGGIFAYGHVSTHTEAGGSGSTRVCLDNYGGTYNLGIDLLATGEVGVKAIGLGEASISTTSSVLSGTPTVISLDSSSNHNNIIALGTGSSGAIVDAGTFNQKYDAQAQTNVVPFATTVPSLTISGISGSTQVLEANSSGVVSGVSPTTTVNGQACTLGSICTIPFAVNGVGNASQVGLNLTNSITDAVGLHVTVSNTGTNADKFEITGGTYTGRSNTTLAFASTPTQCGVVAGAQQFTTGVTAAGNGNCATPGSGIANITITVGTSSIPANGCSAAPITAAMTGVYIGPPGASFSFTPSSDISGVSGWSPSATGQLYFIAWPSANVLNYKICNPTSSSLAPGSSTTWFVSAK